VARSLLWEQAEASKTKIRLNVVIFIINIIDTDLRVFVYAKCSHGLTKKAEPPPTRDVNRDSGTDRANGGWLQRLVRPQNHGFFAK
jgi:hypothetical protein